MTTTFFLYWFLLCFYKQSLFSSFLYFVFKYQNFYHFYLFQLYLCFRCSCLGFQNFIVWEWNEMLLDCSFWIHLFVVHNCCFCCRYEIVVNARVQRTNDRTNECQCKNSMLTFLELGSLFLNRPKNTKTNNKISELVSGRQQQQQQV